MKLFKFITILIILLCAAPLFAKPQVYQESRPAMGSVAILMAYGEDYKLIKRAFQEAFAEIERLESLFSMYRPTSKMVEVNRDAATKPVKISDEFQNVIETALKVGALSDGAFDISYAAMAHLWKFPGPGDKAALPPAAAIDSLKPLVDFRQVFINKEAGTISFGRPGMAVGLGGLVKGYAADRAAAVLKKAGVANCMAYLGGDIAAFGSKGGRPWTVGVQDPRGRGYFATLALQNEAVVSSGDYERYFEEDGRRYHHIIDPRTGYPSRGLRHVTIIGRETMVADALATAVMVLGVEKGLILIKKFSGYEALLVDENNKLHISNGLKERLIIERQPTP